MTKLTVELISPERRLFQREADEITLPGVVGQMTILPGHTHVVAELEPGIVTLRAEGKPMYFALSNGFVEVDHDRVEILAEAAESATEIDEERASASLRQAEEELKRLTADDPRYEEMRQRQARALARIGIARTMHRR